MGGQSINSKHEHVLGKLSIQAGISREEVALLILKLVNITKHDILRKGEATLPYFGKFYIKRLPPRKRKCFDFQNNKHYFIDMPAQDQLKFKINREFSKLFR